MRRRDGPVVVAVCLAALSFVRGAEAAPGARLAYARGPGAESCPDEVAFRKAVAERVGYDPFFPWAPLTVSVELIADKGHLHGRIILETGGIEKGSQTIDDSSHPGGGTASCEDLVGSIALAVSVALDADKAKTVAEEPTPATPEPPTPPPPPAKPETKPETSPAAPPPALVLSTVHEPSRARRVSLWVAGGARVSFGAWPVVGVAPDLLVEMRSGRVGLGLEGQYDALVKPLAVGPGETASVQRGTASVLPCAHFGWFSPCAVATVGATRAHGVDVANPMTQTRPYAAFGGRLGVDWMLVPRLHLLGTIDVVGIATPVRVQVGQDSVSSRPVDASAGIAALVPIF